MNLEMCGNLILFAKHTQLLHLSNNTWMNNINCILYDGFDRKMHLIGHRYIFLYYISFCISILAPNVIQTICLNFQTCQIKLLFKRK